ncbi:MAG: hypothetical protein LQ340_004950, partial [Diploschistes diacapsis]
MVAQDAACPIWVHFAGKQYCSPELERAQQDFRGPKYGFIRDRKGIADRYCSNNADLPFDRVISYDDSLSVSTLYADINSPLFGHFHQTLSETAKAGRTAYRIRYRPPPRPSNKPLVVSGYGVELSLKRTDYIVIDDRAKEKEPTKNDEEVKFEEEDVEDLKPLSASELLQLGLKSSSYIMSHEDPLETLEKISQNFPKHSSAIAQLNISSSFLEEHTQNRKTYLGAGYNVIWMNGLQVDPRQVDAYALLDRVRSEKKLMSNFAEAGFAASEAISLISHHAIAQSKSSNELQRYDYRDKAEGGNVIIWFNDIEKDKRYKDWPTHSSALLQRMFPGQMPALKRDLHNVVIPLDLTDVKDLEIAVEGLQMFVKRSIPVRFGIVPLLQSKEAKKQAVIAHYLQEHYGLSALMAYLSASMNDRKSSEFNEGRFRMIIQDREPRPGRGALEISQIFDVFLPRLADDERYLQRLGADTKAAPLFVNGVALPKNEGWMQMLINKVGMDLSIIQQKLFEGIIPEDTWLAGQFLEGAITRRNALVVPEDESAVKVFDIGAVVKAHEKAYSDLIRVPASKDALQQFLAQATIIADLDSTEGRELLLQALEFRQQQSEVELVVVHNPTEPEVPNLLSAKIFELSLRKKEVDVEELKAVTNLGSKAGIDAEKKHEMAESFWLRMQPLISSFGLKAGENAIILNGRLVGPVPRNATFSSEDFLHLLNYERTKRITPVNTALASLGLEERVDSALTSAKVTSLVALSGVSDVPEGIFDTAATVRMNAFSAWGSNHTAITTGDVDKSTIQLIAAIDPASEIAQRWIPILRVMSELSGVHLKLFLNPREMLQELPIKRFYRHVLEAKLRFDEEGSRVDLRARFEGLPKQALLNLALDVPPAWLVAPKSSIHDLDNIKLDAIKSGADIDAIYALEHILIEGHSRDTTTGQPPRGAQLLLGTESQHHYADTLIMANVGYFQFKANPGYWNIRLKPGRSQQIFTIDSIGANGYYEEDNSQTTEVAQMSFQGKTLFPRLSRKPGREMDDVLDEAPKPGSPQEYLTKTTSLVSSLLSSIGLAPKKEHADINIFSVASGHLYERMLNIMMVSVMRHTRHTVKFWFIEQFLSPSFKETLPHLAAAYKFDYEMVTYKWPHWLRGQREKQREIWGYKILFLDVLFPLSLDKVIFVDADQIVRTDMHDLVTLNLHGAPYGFTPMCDSRTEMEGYRFWKQGYWKRALQGLPYHISALYVVDLKLFRQIAAGDRLRQQYHALSADPNSLSNLDQDLPNNMQAMLPIFSLPQEWLWCETWCSDESLKQARTIDLCNNPETKEPKLQRARRQVPEWTVYDEEIAEV